MAHFAKLNSNNVVTEVIVVGNDIATTEQAGIDFLTSWSGGYTNWKQCSYNANIRKQYPGPGYTYDSGADVFVAPSPHPSWELDGNHDWQPPTPMPVDEKHYIWVEPTGWEETLVFG